MVARLRNRIESLLRRAIAPLAQALVQFGVSPNQVTGMGCVLTIAAAVLLLLGNPVAAGGLFLFASTFDLLDGSMARLTHRCTRAGAFLDSALDRIAEGAMFTAIALHFFLQQDVAGLAAALLAWMGAYLTSYVRARSQSLGADLPEGLVQRAERVVLLSAGLLFDALLAASAVLAVLGIGTATYRAMLAWKRLSDSDSGSDLQHPQRPAEPEDDGDGHQFAR